MLDKIKLGCIIMGYHSFINIVFCVTIGIWVAMFSMVVNNE